MKCSRRSLKDSWGVVPASTMAKNTNNPIGKTLLRMNLEPNPAKEMITLSIGDPTTFGNLPPHEVIEEAFIESLKSQKNNGRAPAVGQDKARAVIASHLSRPEAPLTAEDVILTTGCSSALEIAIAGLASRGQNILVPRPGFPLCMLAEPLGIEVRYYQLCPEKDWEVDLDDLESLVDHNTACMVVNNPSNPCGSVFSPDHIRDILNLADRLRLPVIADEIYADLVFPGQRFISMTSLLSNVPILVCGGIGKKYLVPGWRFGWILIYDRNGTLREIREGLNALADRIHGSNTIVQGALDAILKNTPSTYFNNTIDLVQRNAEHMYNAVKQIKGLKPHMPAGAMYMLIGIDMASFPEFADDVDFTQCLVNEQSVFCLPAVCFNYPNYFRVVLTVPEETVAEACHRLHEFCSIHCSPQPLQSVADTVNIDSVFFHELSTVYCSSVYEYDSSFSPALETVKEAVIPCES